jgi:hypothetical protein
MFATAHARAGVLIVHEDKVCCQVMPADGMIAAR